VNEKGAVCGAKRSAGPGYCQARPVKGKTRCKWHGGRSTGPKTAEGKHRWAMAGAAGRAKWLERQKALKALGLIDRIPVGKKPRAVVDAIEAARSPLTGDPVIDKAKTIIAAAKVAAARVCPHCGGALDAVPNELQPRPDLEALGFVHPNRSRNVGLDKLGRGRNGTLVSADGLDVVESPQQTLTRVNAKSLHLIESIIDMPIDTKAYDVGQQLKVLGIKKDAALSMTGLTARVDANALKAREIDMMPALLERLARIEGPK
jgi:hypothetical protein